MKVKQQRDSNKYIMMIMLTYRILYNIMYIHVLVIKLKKILRTD